MGQQKQTCHLVRIVVTKTVDSKIIKCKYNLLSQIEIAKLISHSVQQSKKTAIMRILQDKSRNSSAADELLAEILAHNEEGI